MRIKKRKKIGSHIRNIDSNFRAIRKIREVRKIEWKINKKSRGFRKLVLEEEEKKDVTES